jgi:hypothetical protein
MADVHPTNLKDMSDSALIGMMRESVSELTQTNRATLRTISESLRALDRAEHMQEVMVGNARL